MTTPRRHFQVRAAGLTIRSGLRTVRRFPPDDESAMTPTWLTAAPLAVFLAAWAGTRLVLGLLRRRAILDHPNERSSHAVPTPRGGGLAVAPVIIIAWAAGLSLLPGAASSLWPLIAGAALLAAVSWADDLRSLPPHWRLAAQFLAVAAGIFALPANAPVFQGLLPGWLDTLAAAVLWVWFVNLFNFMDGIDGITGTETAFVAAGAAAITLIAGGPPFSAYAGLTTAAAALGFLAWNWPPARIFLGDVGSVTLGFLVGWLLLDLAGRGLWAPALILPLYYLADATITLGRRLARGEKVWLAHRSHFYQLAVRRGCSHASVVRVVIAANTVLAALAVLTVLLPQSTWPALAAAVLTVAVLLRRLSAGAR